MRRQGMGRPATRAASCLEADSGCTASGRVRLASARSCVPLRAIDRHPNRPALEPNPSSGPRAPMLLRDAGGCDDGSALRCTCSHDLTGRFRSKGQKRPAHPKRGQIDRAHQALPESVTLRSLSERLTLVAAVTSTLLRHGGLRAERNEPPWYSSRKPKVPPLYPSVHSAR